MNSFALGSRRVIMLHELSSDLETVEQAAGRDGGNSFLVLYAGNSTSSSWEAKNFLEKTSCLRDALSSYFESILSQPLDDSVSFYTVTERDVLRVLV